MTTETPKRDVSSQSDIMSAARQNDADGAFKRPASSFRSFIEKDGKFAPEAGRYRLYASLACPWATRCLIARKLKGLEDIIAVTITSPRMGTQGWPFAAADEFPGAEVDPLYNAHHVKDLYLRADPNFDSRFTVPVLWDTKLETIVNNESSEILRSFNAAFNDILPSDKASVDLYPVQHRQKIDELNEWIYPNINNGVYRSGFASTTVAYEEAVTALFKSLDDVEKLLDGKEFIVGDSLTECDIRLWVTAVRFDPVYFSHFKCNIRNIRNGYPAINKWMKNLYWNNSAFSSSTDFHHIKTAYYWSQPNLNPTRIVPIGPIPNIEAAGV